MSDAGNIDIGSKLGTPKPTAPNENKKEISTPTEIKKTNKGDLVKQENRTVYNKRTESQESFKSTKSSDTNNDPSENKPYKFSANNPILESKLSNRKKVNLTNNKDKKPPPQPNLRVRLSPKGIAINPRKVKPHMPGRLKSFFDDRIKMIDKLNEAIQIDNINLDDINLLNNQAKKLLSNNAEFITSASLAELLKIDIDIAKLNKQEILDLLDSKISELNEDPDLQQYLKNIIAQIDQNTQILTPLLQLFMPFPLPFLFAEIDDEFYEDEEELYDDDDENFFSKDDDKQDDEDEEDEFDSEASLSIKTLNFNKIHFLIRYNKKQNKIKVGIKGDPSATELAIPIETNLEDALEDDIDDIDYLLRLWTDKVLRVTETRILKVQSKGKLNPIILKACNSILDTIGESDINLDDDDTIDASYNMI